MDIIDSLVPPPDADPKRVALHRWRITVVACVAFCGLAFFVPFAMGWFPIFPGFASREELQKLLTTINEERQSTLDQQIFALRVLHCQTHDDAAKQLYLGRLRDLTTRYLRITGQVYVLPACADF